MMKNAFYFKLKALSVLKIFKFNFDFLAMWKNGLIQKIRLIFEFLTSQPGWQTVVIHFLTNIPRSKGNQTMKIAQLIEYSMKHFP